MSIVAKPDWADAKWGFWVAAGIAAFFGLYALARMLMSRVSGIGSAGPARRKGTGSASSG